MDKKSSGQEPIQIKKNEEYVMDIRGMTHEGQGVGTVKGFTVFVDGAVTGETVEAKIIKIAKNYAVGKLLNIKSKSADRVEPFCKDYSRCGGCSLQHMDYKAQLRFKTNLVTENIKRIGKIEDVVIHDTLGMENPLNYRNKSQYPVGMDKGSTAIGFYAKRSHDIVDSRLCGIQSEVSDKIRSVVREFLKEKGIAAYDEASQTGLVRHVVVRTGYRTKEVMVVIVINGKDLPHKEQLVKVLKDTVNDLNGWALKSVFLNLNKKNTNVIFGDKSIRISGSDTITDYIGKFKFNISPISFFQVNPLQTEVLYSKALDYAGLTGSETVFDLYCGIGTISLFLSQKAKKVYGVEVVEAAIEDARKNAELNEVDNVEFIAGEAEKVIPELYREGITADVVVVDPPRKGCDEMLLKTLVDMEPQRVVYVSCNPATLARDLNYLSGKGYKAVEVQPVDMFPHTHHVEAIVLIQREYT